jgi:hypothetical protein
MIDNFSLQVILSIIFLSIITFFGYLFSNRVLKENNPISLIPISVTFGCSLFIFLLHFISLVLGVQTATYISIGTFILGIIYISLSVKPLILESALNKRESVIIFCLSAFLFLLCLSYLIYFNTFDPLYHNAATLIKQKSYPPFNPYNSETLSSYHYGLILLASSLAIFSNIDVWNSFIPIQLLFIVTIPLSIFSLVYFIRRKFNEAFFAALIGCFCANLNSPLLIKHLSILIFHGFDYKIYNKIIGIADSTFATNTCRSLASPNMCLATQMTMVLFYLSLSFAFNKLNKDLIVRLFTIFIISATFFFIYESFWVVPVIGSLLYHLITVLNGNNRIQAVKTFISLFIIFSTSPFITGGILNNGEKSSLSLVYINPKNFLTCCAYNPGFKPSKEWTDNHMVLENSTGGVYFKVKPSDWKFYNDLGLPFICLPFVLFWIIKQRSTGLLALAISGIFMLLVPFFISFQLREVELIRFPTCARFIFSVLFGSFLGFYINKYSKSWIFKSMVLGLIFTLISPVIIWLLPHQFKSKDWRYTHIPKIHKKAIKWLSKKVELGDKGIGPFDFPCFYYDLITTAGVYGISTSETGGFIVEKETRKTALKLIDPCLFRELKAKWLYVNKDVSSLITKENLNKAIKSKMLVLRYRDTNSTDFVEIYEHIPNYADNNCSNKAYNWAVGRIYMGTFFPLQNNLTKEKIVFTNKENAKEFLREYIKSLDKREKYWYRIEAIPLETNGK